MDALLMALDLAGTFAVALSGATAGVRHRLDLFGVLVLAGAAASAGGLARDVLIGATPPAALDDWRYLAVAGLAGGSPSPGPRRSPGCPARCSASTPPGSASSPSPAR